ncbi:MAG: hypothetical protein Q4C91_10215 [Eubacteriales bacterium]|nr:hypothetical protein [Eubacteriales bacterium]
MEELEFSRELVKISDKNILQKALKKAGTQGFVVQGFKNVFSAPVSMINASLGKRKRGGKYQSTILLECLASLEESNEEVNLARGWLENEKEREKAQEELLKIKKDKEQKTVQNEKGEEQEQIIAAVSLPAEVGNINNLEQIVQQKEKIKRQQNTIQELRIVIDDYKREKDRLQKENAKLQNECNKQQREIDRLIECKKNLEIQMKQYFAELEEKHEEIKYYKSILEYAPKVLCFSKKNINESIFPLKRIEQLNSCEEQILQDIGWKCYSEIWIIESDFSYSEVLKIKRASQVKVICVRNLKSLIEKRGGNK